MKKKKRSNEDNGEVSKLKPFHQRTLDAAVEEHGLKHGLKYGLKQSVRGTEYSLRLEKSVQNEPLDSLIRSKLQPLDLMEEPPFLDHVGEVIASISNSNSDIAISNSAESIPSSLSERAFESL